ncbi:MAG: DUF4405 domain-containing protein [Anaerolineales bacterium]|nr:DUF4405 domain-containing protein [Anaerolineales bacterium]
MRISLNTTNKIKLSLDVITFVSTLVLLSPPITGIPIHEWLGLAVIIPLLVHLLINWGWLSSTTRRFFGRLPGQTRINYLLNWALFILMTAEGFTGVMISKVVLPMFGLSASHVYIYKYLHIILADSLLIVFGLHLAMHWRWILTVIKKNILAPFFGQPKSVYHASATTHSSINAE